MSDLDPARSLTSALPLEERQQQIKFFFHSRCVTPLSISRALFATSLAIRQSRTQARPFKSFGAALIS